ncbi:MAG: hypothetical protein Tsb0019_09000 [Roseibium sp.]
MISRQESSHLAEHRRLADVISAMTGAVGRLEVAHPSALPDGSLAADLALQAHVDCIRAGYLTALGRLTAQRWRTPPTGTPIPFPGSGDAYDYAYDRQHPPLALESRLSRQSGRQAMLCSSGMAALHVVLQGLGHYLARDGRLVALASYFETLTLLRLGPFAETWSRAMSSDQLAERILEPETAVILIEPVRYDWNLSTEDWSPVLEALSARSDPPVVILDTTLCATVPALADLMDRLQLVASLVIDVRSGLKLDQLGFELANVGVVEWTVRPDCEDRFRPLASILPACRVATGATLTWPDACALAPAFVFDRDAVGTYAKGVFETNRALARAMPRPSALFSHVTYPDGPWVAPFVIFGLRTGGSDAYRGLARLIHQEQHRRGLNWQMSGSFGFRSSRFETILPDEQARPGEDPEGVLKVACGCYAGAQFQAIVELLQELSEFPDLETAARVWGRSCHAHSQTGRPRHDCEVHSKA